MSVALFAVRTARAAVPADYQGKPFDPAVAGGAGIIPATVKAGPYPVPGHIDFVNYDMGGDGVGYHTDAHYTTKGGDGYRSDRPSATLCLTANSKPDVYYDTGTAQDGMPYPSATGADFYVGSVHPNDWFNYTVDVKMAGTYTLSAYFATGNGPPGGEGGDGQMELLISVNGMQQADWKAVFPDFQDKANFHNWKAYPDFAKLTLEQGVSVIKFQAPFKHLNLDYVELALEGAGGMGSGGAGGVAGSASSGAGGTVVSGGGADSAGAGAAASTGAGAASGGAASGGTSTGGAATGGATTEAGSAGTAAAGMSSSADSGGCSCALGKQLDVARLQRLALLGLALGGFFIRRKRR